MLSVGTKAPEFKLLDQNGKEHKLSDYKGKKVVLYFYPKDNTPGCTKQACSFSDNLPHFTSKNAIVLGISKDSVKSHKNFSEKYALSFDILSDEELVTLKDYDVWKEKKNYGKTYMGILRTTYLIDEDGMIVQASDKVKPDQDAERMLNFI